MGAVLAGAGGAGAAVVGAEGVGAVVVAATVSAAAGVDVAGEGTDVVGNAEGAAVVRAAVGDLGWAMGTAAVAPVSTPRVACWNMTRLRKIHVVKMATITANSSLAAPSSRDRRSTSQRPPEHDFTHWSSAGAGSDLSELPDSRADPSPTALTSLGGTSPDLR